MAEEPPPLSPCLFKPSPSLSTYFMHALIYPMPPSYMWPSSPAKTVVLKLYRVQRSTKEEQTVIVLMGLTRPLPLHSVTWAGLHCHHQYLDFEVQYVILIVVLYLFKFKFKPQIYSCSTK